MADDGLNALNTAAELDELELEELTEGDDTTGEFLRASAATQASKIVKPARSSVPPPLPPQARETRRSSLPPPGSLPPPPAARVTFPPPPAGVTLPPPPPAAGVTVPPRPPRSGVFRIDPSVRPPLPAKPASVPAPAPTPVAATVEVIELRRQLTALTAELREARAYVERLRLTVRLRDDAVGELQQAAREQRERADALERELQQAAREQRERVDALERELARLRAEEPDDLKRIPGIGPGFERALHAAGVTTFQQIAEWTLEDIERVAPQLRTAPRRILREGWIERAKEITGAKPS
jgi:predicted flap endonuclease-1-like 5' DNA nuclease